jgi:hypothetical protein
MLQLLSSTDFTGIELGLKIHVYPQKKWIEFKPGEHAGQETEASHP